MKNFLPICGKIIKRRETKAVLLALAMGFSFAFTVAASGFYSENTQRSLADSVLRFHVRANSSDEIDQQLKMIVKDGVLKRFRKELEQAEDLEQTRAFISNNLDAIEACAEEIISTEGYNYTAAAYISTDYFPTRTYGDVRLPAGNYDTLRIDIGAAQGENWWCVMFPPLCYVDVSVKEIPQEEKNRLKNILTEDEFALITSDSRDVRIKFKIVELWQRLKFDNEFYFAFNRADK